MRARNLLPVAALLIALGTASCAESAQDAVQDRTNDAANQAKETSKQVAREAAKAELCGYVQDNKVSANEAIALRASADVAQAAGVEQPLVDAARTVANASDGAAPQNDVERFAAECK